MFLLTGRTAMMRLLLTKFNLEIWKTQLIFPQGVIWSGNRQVTGCGGALKPTQEGLSTNLQMFSRLLLL